MLDTIFNDSNNLKNGKELADLPSPPPATTAYIPPITYEASQDNFAMLPLSL